MIAPTLIADDIELRRMLHLMYQHDSTLQDPDRLADAREAIKYITRNPIPHDEADTFLTFSANSWIEAHTKLWMRYLSLFWAQHNGAISTTDADALHLALLWTELTAIQARDNYPRHFVVEKK